MKIGVIDIGSNSVRLMMSENGITLFKRVNITALARNFDGINLDKDAIVRTENAISNFILDAKKYGAENVFCFGTAAMRKAKNSKIIVDDIYKKHNVKIEIISGEIEAKLGYIGALKNADGGVIDIGGASSEIIVVENGIEKYSYSLDLGCVSIYNQTADLREKVLPLVKEKVKLYKSIPKATFYGIGGTATSVASLLQSLEIYDPKKVDGYVIQKEPLKGLRDRLFSMTEQERMNLKGIEPERARIIVGGIALLYEIMEYIGIDKVTASESDNLEGYIKYKNLIF